MDDSRRPPTGTSRLNVLFIGGFDSTNYVYVELIREFEARGHRCTVVVENERDAVNNKMFAAAGIPVTPIGEFPVDDLSSIDVAFSGQFIRRPQRALFDAIARDGVLLVSFANLFSSVTMWAPADLVITSGTEKFAEFAENGLAYNMVAVGNPQYDPLVRARPNWRASSTGEIRRVLVVDQGAYPLGEQGKRQLAECLLGIAAGNPEVRFDVKPRYLPDEEGEHLHKASQHLYHYLNDAPPNLVLIREATVLEELVTEYDAMITTWSTAHLDAVVLGMPLMVIGGLDSIDVFDVRRPRVDAAYAHLHDTGCVVDWRQAREGRLPLAAASEAYAAREFYDIEAASAPNVVDLVEAIDRTVLAAHARFDRAYQLGFREYMAQLEAGVETRPAGSNADRLGGDLYRKTNAIIQELAFENRCMGYVLDMAEVLPFWQRRLGERSGEDGVAAVVGELKAKVAAMKERYFRSHPDEIASDPFVQDAFFDWLYATGQRSELLHYDGPVVAPESLSFNQGMVLLRRGRLFSAATHFVDSFSVSLVKPVLQLRRDKHIAVVLSGTDTSLLAHAILFFLGARSKYDALCAVDAPLRPGFEAVVYYRMKALVALGRPDEARAVHARFAESAREHPRARRRRGLPGALLGVLIGGYGVLLRRLARRLG